MPVSFFEFTIVVVAVILFVRPEDLPKFLRTAGRLYGAFQAWYRQAQNQTRDTFRELSELDLPKSDPPPAEWTGQAGSGPDDDTWSDEASWDREHWDEDSGAADDHPGADDEPPAQRSSTQSR